MTLSRARGGPARTLGPVGVEERLERECSAKGETHLNGIRDGARRIAPLAGKTQEFEALDALIGGLLRTRMNIWSFCIAARQDLPDLGSGFVRANTAEEALARIGHPEANVYPCATDVDLPSGRGPFFEGIQKGPSTA